MKTILVTGSRHWTDLRVVRDTLYPYAVAHDNQVVLIHGAARGADSLAAQAGLEFGWAVRGYPADWKAYGPEAGPLRNQRMLDEGQPDTVLAFHGNLAGSKGTKDCVRRALRAGLLVHLVRPNGSKELLLGVESMLAEVRA